MERSGRLNRYVEMWKIWSCRLRRIRFQILPWVTKYRVMNEILLRTAGILLHGVANFILVTLLFDFDISGSWLLFIGFILVMALLLFLFIKHLVAYIYFLKSKSK